MGGRRIIPETANRQDWPRLVSQAQRDHENRIIALEAGGISGSGTFTIDDGDASGGGSGFDFDDGGA